MTKDLNNSKNLIGKRTHHTQKQRPSHAPVKKQKSQNKNELSKKTLPANESKEKTPEVKSPKESVDEYTHEHQATQTHVLTWQAETQTEQVIDSVYSEHPSRDIVQKA